MSTHKASHMDNLARELMGQSLHIPNIKMKFIKWPAGLNSNLDKLRLEVDRMIKTYKSRSSILNSSWSDVYSITTDEEILRSFEKCDFGRLACLYDYPIIPSSSLLTRKSYYPNATWERLQVGAAYLVWVFIWDDEIDLGNTKTAKNKNLTRGYCERSRNFVHSSLGLSTTKNIENMGTGHLSKIMGIFDEFGHGICKSANIGL